MDKEIQIRDLPKFSVWNKKEERFMTFEEFKKGEIEFNFNPNTKQIWIEFDPNKYQLFQAIWHKYE